MDYADSIASAADLLRAAARAAKVPAPTPWAIDRTGPADQGDVLYAENGNIVADRSADQPGEDVDLPYLALANPDFGLAVAAMLDDELNAYQAAVAGVAATFPHDETRRRDWLAARENVHTLNLARLIHEAAARNGLAAAVAP
ncbi:hypothetical protein [Streptomyces sp. NRRL S-350]|uniref:hypothetical protein n=1 Tax=Streptomyces sp. NRRL S-350 TaxID=1463902 RepID=UPI0004BEB2E9|nr:hypothetical protein [Streptomyces sp. NRRL S-350]